MEPPANENEQKACEVVGLPLHLEVVRDAESDQNFYLLTKGEQLAKLRSQFWAAHSYSYAALALGSYASFVAGMIFIGCLILTALVSVLRFDWQLTRPLSGDIVRGRLPVNGFVEITAEGVLEIESGVECRFGWSAMNQWLFWRSMLFIELKNGKWVVLPQKGLKPEGFDLRALRGLLRVKEVPGRDVDSPA